MEITCKGNVIENIFDWKKVIQPKDWRPWRSAPSLAEFILHRDGIDEIKSIVYFILKEEFELTEAVIEYESNFDDFPNGRKHDLGIKGITKAGKSIFIGLEAKVDEEFGPTIASYYKEGLKNENSDIPKRIEGLLSLIFPNEKPDFESKLRYQLHHATAGTLHEKEDIRIFLILSLKTIEYVNSKGERNKTDLAAFVNSIEPNSEIKYGDDLYRLVTIDGKKLHIVHKVIPFK